MKRRTFNLVAATAAVAAVTSGLVVGRWATTKLFAHPAVSVSSIAESESQVTPLRQSSNKQRAQLARLIRGLSAIEAAHDMQISREQARSVTPVLTGLEVSAVSEERAGVVLRLLTAQLTPRQLRVARLITLSAPAGSPNVRVSASPDRPFDDPLSGAALASLQASLERKFVANRSGRPSGLSAKAGRGAEPQ